MSGLRICSKHLSVWILLISVFLVGTAADAFSPEMRKAMWAVYDGTASDAQKSMVLGNYKTFNLMGLADKQSGGVPDKVYQANQKMFAEFNKEIVDDTLNYMGMEGQGHEVKASYKAGTDTDINVKFKNKRGLRVKDLQDTRDYYNVTYSKKLRRMGHDASDDMNWAAHTETDIMPDASSISSKEFDAAAKFVNRKGGWMYDDKRAVHVEIGKASNSRIDVDDATAYATEMLSNIEKKNAKVIKQRKLLKAVMNKKNKSSGRLKEVLQEDLNQYKAEIFLNEAQMAKYHKRLDDLNNALREQNGLPPVTKKTRLNQLVESSAKRRSGTAQIAAELTQKSGKIKQQQTKELTKTYAELAEKADNIKLRKRYLKDAGELTRELDEVNRKVLLKEVDNVVGRKSGVAKSFELEIEKANRPDKVAVYAPKVMAAAGVVNDVFSTYDAYKEGGIKGATEHMTVTAISGQIIGAGTKKLIAVIPSAGPVLAVAGTGMTAYEVTRNVMSRTVIGGKTLDEHTQEGIDNALYVSATDKQMRDAKLTKMLVKLVKNGKVKKPENMSINEMQQELLKRANAPGSELFAEFGEGEKKENVEPEQAAEFGDQMIHIPAFLLYPAQDIPVTRFQVARTEYAHPEMMNDDVPFYIINLWLATPIVDYWNNVKKDNKKVVVYRPNNDQNSEFYGRWFDQNSEFIWMSKRFYEMPQVERWNAEGYSSGQKDVYALQLKFWGNNNRKFDLNPDNYRIYVIPMKIPNRVREQLERKLKK